MENSKKYIFLCLQFDIWIPESPDLLWKNSIQIDLEEKDDYLLLLLLLLSSVFSNYILLKQNFFEMASN